MLLKAKVLEGTENYRCNWKLCSITAKEKTRESKGTKREPAQKKGPQINI